MGNFVPTGFPTLPTKGRFTVDPVHGYTFGNHPDFSPAQQSRLEQVLVQRKGAFTYSQKDLVGCHGPVGDFKIDLTDELPLIAPRRRRAPIEREVEDEKNQELLEAGIIRPETTSQYISETTLPVKKDADGNYTDRRVCLDYRPLNQETVMNYYGLHRLDEIFQKLAGAKFFSVLDLRACYHQIPVAQEDKPKATFRWGNKLFMMSRLPMGLMCAVLLYCWLGVSGFATRGVRQGPARQALL